jgi:hypothetical protein
MYIKAAWNDYFTGSPNSELSKKFGTRQSLSVTNVYVLNSLFGSITSSDYGGALYCTSVTLLLVESTFFFSCKTSEYYGGTIYFYNTGNGQCALSEVCGFDCFSTRAGASSGQFVYITVCNSATSKNYVNYSSISRCVNINSDSYDMLRIEYGINCCPSVNMSMNKCYGRTGIQCIPFGDSNSVTCSLTYSSFADNIAAGYTCIFLWRTGANYEIKCCNILRNTQVSSSEGTIWVSGNLMIEDSCVLENKATYIFYVSSSYTITLSNCTVDKTSKTGSFITENTVTKSFILALNHMSTRNCHSEYDSAGTLTPVIQSPSSSKKQLLCFTYGNFFYQYQLRYLVSIISVFLFNFIHLGASSNFFI